MPGSGFTAHAFMLNAMGGAWATAKKFFGVRDLLTIASGCTVPPLAAAAMGAAEVARVRDMERLCAGAPPARARHARHRSATHRLCRHWSRWLLRLCAPPHARAARLLVCRISHAFGATCIAGYSSRARRAGSTRRRR